MEIVDASSLGGQFGFKMCFEEVRKQRKRKLEGAESKLGAQQETDISETESAKKFPNILKVMIY